MRWTLLLVLAACAPPPPEHDPDPRFVDCRMTGQSLPAAAMRLSGRPAVPFAAEGDARVLSGNPIVVELNDTVGRFPLARLAGGKVQVGDRLAVDCDDCRERGDWDGVVSAVPTGRHDQRGDDIILRFPAEIRFDALVLTRDGRVTHGPWREIRLRPDQLAELYAVFARVGFDSRVERDPFADWSGHSVDLWCLRAQRVEIGQPGLEPLAAAIAGLEHRLREEVVVHLFVEPAQLPEAPRRGLPARAWPSDLPVDLEDASMHGEGVFLSLPEGRSDQVPWGLFVQGWRAYWVTRHVIPAFLADDPDELRHFYCRVAREVHGDFSWIAHHYACAD